MTDFPEVFGQANTNIVKAVVSLEGEIRFLRKLGDKKSAKRAEKVLNSLQKIRDEHNQIAVKKSMVH
ncbi:hypothetical protein ACFLZ7_03670 [Nanoarchaeota archaeon]